MIKQLFLRYGLCLLMSFAFCIKPYAATETTFFLAPLKTAHMRPVYTWMTHHGVQVLFYQAMEVPILDIGIGFHAGSAYDGAAFGVSALTTQLLDQGSKAWNADQIAEQFANTGAQYAAETNQDLAMVHLKTLTAQPALNRSIDTFAHIISHPHFPSEAFQRLKNQQLITIAQSQESPEVVANHTFFSALYQNHPYAHPIMGDKEHVERLSLEDVHAFYHRYFVSRNAVLVLVGAIELAEAHTLAERITKDLKEGQSAPLIQEAPPLKEGMDIMLPFTSTQAVVRLGQIAINHRDPRYFPLMVGNYCLGGASMVSRLTKSLREAKGFAYSVYSQFLPMPAKGPFIISIATRKDQAKAALALVQETLLHFVADGVTHEELQAAKQFLTGSFSLSLASNRSIAEMLLKIGCYHIPNNFLETYIQKVNAVTAADVKTAFQSLIVPKDLLQLTVGALQ